MSHKTCYNSVLMMYIIVRHTAVKIGRAVSRKKNLGGGGGGGATGRDGYRSSSSRDQRPQRVGGAMCGCASRCIPSHAECDAKTASINFYRMNGKAL